MLQDFIHLEIQRFRRFNKAMGLVVFGRGWSKMDEHGEKIIGRNGVLYSINLDDQ